MVVKDRFKVPLVDVVTEHFADRFDVGETVGRLDEFAQEVLAVADGVGGLLHFEVAAVDAGAVFDAGEYSVPTFVFVVPDVEEESGRSLSTTD